jgi:rare lipoprotein A
MMSAMEMKKFGQVTKIGTLGVVLLLAVGCGHAPREVEVEPEQLAPAPRSYQPPQQQRAYGQQQQYYAPQPHYADQENYPQQQSRAIGRIPVTPVPPGGVTDADYDFIESHRPMESEFGLATWYTAPYKGRAAANGQVFDDMALTAAHRTLPMGSLVVVTNLKTGQASAMRISDRGPFVDGRIVDLTIASARATGIYRQGVAQVRVDVYQTPKPIETGGRWCVQIGAFSNEEEAVRLKRELLTHYPGARVIEFPGEKAFWVRIRPEGDDRGMAEYIAQHLRPAEGEAFLTRLD